MKYNPAIHHRRSIRLKGYDYSKEGMYFNTICCDCRKCWFGNIENEIMILNEYGKIADHKWNDLPNRFLNIELGEFRIMPNHMHDIIMIQSSDSGSGVSPDHTNPTKTNTINKTVGDMVGAYKSIVAVKCLAIFKMQNQKMGKLWQRNYYEHIIRDEQSFNNISSYIIYNPKNWQHDKFNI